jgi:flagellar hook-associated protein 3 FlgL
MRLSTLQIFNQGVGAIQEKQSQVAKTSLQLSTGKRILSPSDDPTGAVQSVELRSAIQTTEQYQKNITQAEARLNLEESALEGVGNNLQRVRELALQGNNATQTNEDRHSIAAEVRQRLDEVLDLANTRDANGEYIFAGFTSQTEPFSPNAAGGFSYYGDDGQRSVRVGPVRHVAMGDPGSKVFMEIPNGNGTLTARDNPANTGTGVIDAGSVTDFASWIPDTYTITFSAPDSYEVIRDSDGTLVSSGAYTSGQAIAFAGVQATITGAPAVGDSFTLAPSQDQDLFTTYQNLISALETPVSSDADRTDLNNAVNRFLSDIDQASERILDTRSSVGARLNSLDSQQDINEGSALALKETLSTVEDLDYAQAISRLQLELAGLEAAQQSYLKVQGLSLFDYMG